LAGRRRSPSARSCLSVASPRRAPRRARRGSRGHPAHLRRHVAEGLIALEGQLEGRALEVLDEDLDVVGVDARVLDGRARVTRSGASRRTGRAAASSRRRAPASEAPCAGRRGRSAARARRSSPGIRRRRPRRASRCRCPARARSSRRRSGSPRAQALLDARRASRAGSHRDRPDELGSMRTCREALAKVLEHHLDGVARLAEDQRRHVGAHEVEREFETAVLV
jgi:hypothetical protein